MEPRQTFDPARIRQWNGPAPTDDQLCLLEACWAPLDEAQRLWWRWRQRCDFEHESPVSHELASLAALRLGERAGHCTIALRSKGLYRRDWLLSQLAMESTLRLTEMPQLAGLPLIVRGDLAMLLLGPTFEGRAFPVRCLRFALAPQPHRQKKLLGARKDLEVATRRTDLLRIEVAPAPRWLLKASQVAPAPYTNLRVLPLPLLLADLVASNWRWGPPGGLRWVLELVQALEQAPDPDALAEEIVAGSIRMGSVPALQATIQAFGTRSAAQCFEPLRLKLKGVRASWRSHWRIKAMTAPPRAWQHRGVRMLDQLRTRLQV